MANKQIHELPAAPALVPEDQLVVSQAGSNATRRAALSGLPFQPVLAGAARRTIARIKTLQNERARAQAKA